MTCLRLVVMLIASSMSVRAAEAVWRPFSDDSPWNRPITADAALDPDSAALVADLAQGGPWLVNVTDWSIPLYFVEADKTPRYAVTDSRPDIYGLGFEFPRHIPIPDNAVPSPPARDDSDYHLCIVDRAKGLEWGMWYVRRDAHGVWSTGLGAVTDLRGNGVAAPWFACRRELDAARARASGFPLIAGLIRLEEIKAGRIEHALVYATNRCRTGFFVSPASTAQVTVPKTRTSFGVPMGGRIQLDPAWAVDSSSLSPAGKIIARALQKYGAFCGDYADGNVFYAENSREAVAQWAGVLAFEELAAVFTPEFLRTHFRVLDLGNVLPGQNCEIPSPYIISLGLGRAATDARIDYFTRRIFAKVPEGTDLTRVPVQFQLYPAEARLSMGERTLGSERETIDARKPVRLRLQTTAGTEESETWTLYVWAEPAAK